jgi:hypothetical protein
MAKQLTEAQMRKKFLMVLEQNGGEATAAEMVEGTGFAKAQVNEIAKALVKEKVVLPAPGGKIALPEEPEEAPAPKKVAPPKAAGKRVAPPEDDDSNELDGEEDDGFGLDDDEGLDADGDEGFDAEDETPAPKAAKSKTKAVTLAPPHQEFSMAFRPIDTLDDDELTERIEMSTAAAESLNEQGHELVAEMLMRSVAKARRQLNKRQQ